MGKLSDSMSRAGRWFEDTWFKRRRVFVFESHGPIVRPIEGEIEPGMHCVRDRAGYDRLVAAQPGVTGLMAEAIGVAETERRMDSGRAILIVRIERGEAVGCIFVLAARGKPFWHDCLRIEADMGIRVTLWVTPAARGGGLGSKLIDAANLAALSDPQIKRVIGVVEWRNQPSIRSFRRLGSDRQWRNYLLKWRGRNFASIVIGWGMLRIWRIRYARSRSGFLGDAAGAEADAGQTGHEPMAAAAPKETP